MPLASELQAYETQTLSYLRGRGELTPGTYHSIPVEHFNPKGRDGYYTASPVGKRMIVLHFTAGYLGGDLATLTKDSFRVSVPFVIARNGTIVKLFDTRYWSFHLGPGAVGGNTTGSKQSVAIELSNVGPLDLAGNWLWTAWGSKYCKVSEVEYYQELATPYRGSKYYATFTDAQYEAVDALLIEISDEHGVPLTFLSEPDRYDMFASAAEAKTYRGVCSHVNFRPPTDKSDIGPAFGWSRIGA